MGGVLRTPAPPVDTREIEADGGRWLTVGERVLEYAVLGPEGGTPVIAVSPYSQTCYFYAMPFMKDLYARYNLRVYAISQPGFGLSDCHPLGHKRLLKDWPLDVEKLMQKERISGNFYVLGMSAGGAHGLVTAIHFKDRCLGGFLLAPTMDPACEVDAGVQRQRATEAVKWALCTAYLGDAVARMLAKVDSVQRMNAAPDVKAAMQRIEKEPALSHLKPSRDAFCADSDRCVKHTFRGWCDNMCTMCEGWTFDLAELAGQRFCIVSAPDDGCNPPEMQTWLAGMIPGCQLVVVPEGFGHFSGMLPSNWERGLEYMVGRTKIAAAAQEVERS